MNQAQPNSALGRLQGRPSYLQRNIVERIRGELKEYRWIVKANNRNVLIVSRIVEDIENLFMIGCGCLRTVSPRAGRVVSSFVELGPATNLEALGMISEIFS